MSEVITIEITFRGPFHVARGDAVPGLDRTVDHAVPLPASSLKGLMRAESRLRLRLPQPLIDQVFGSPATPAPWAWSDAALIRSQLGRVNRIKIADGATGEVDKGMLLFGEHVWATSAQFTIEQIAPIPRDLIETHALVLQACARSVTALGGGRRRGEGWVTLCPIREHAAWTEQSTTRVLELATPQPQRQGGTS